MNLDLDSMFGVHADALRLRAQRAEVLAANLANADTPGYQARDIDFRAVLAQASSGASALATTDSRHLRAGGASTGGAELMYRTPLAPSLDGNTVDPQVEHAAFAENAVRYQASLQFLDTRIAGIRRALTGD